MATPPQISETPDLQPLILAYQKRLLDEAATLIIDSEIMILRYYHDLLRDADYVTIQRNSGLVGAWRDIMKRVSETIGIHPAQSAPSVLVQQIYQTSNEIISPQVLDAMSRLIEIGVRSGAGDAKSMAVIDVSLANRLKSKAKGSDNT